MLCYVKSNLPINCEIEVEVFKWVILFFVLFWATTKLHFVNIFHTSNISAASLVFLKKRDFLRLTIVFFKILPHFDKSDNIFNAVPVAFLDFTDVSSYLAFKLSAWRRDCTTSFYHCHKLHRFHFRKFLQSFYKRK